MAMLKSLRGFTRLDGRMKEYLENGSAASMRRAVVEAAGAQAYFERAEKEPDRLLGMDYLNLHVHERKDWARAMDETRKKRGNDQSWNGKTAVYYRQFIISPDPEDDVSLDQLRKLAVGWAEKKFGDHGELGRYQVAIAYHDDNENRIPHAHIIVNNTDLDTGRRLHIGGKEYDMLRVDLQKMCIARCMRYLDFQADDPDEAARWVSKLPDSPDAVPRGRWRPVKQTDLERGRTYSEEYYLDSGIRLWKDDLRDAIEKAADAAVDAKDFFSILDEQGVGHQLVKGGDILYSHPEKPEARKVLGKNLGTGFTVDGVCEHIVCKIGDVDERAFARGGFLHDVQTMLDQQRGMRTAGKGRGNSHRKVGNTLWKRSQEVYRTDSERAVKRGGVHLWKDDLRDWAAIAASTTQTLDEWRGYMAELGVQTEVRDGDILYHHPSAPDSRKCYGAKLGQRFTPQGIMKQQYAMKSVQQAFSVNSSLKAELVEVASFNVDESSGVTLQEAARAFDAVRRAGAADVDDLAAELRRVESRIARQRDAGEDRKAVRSERYAEDLRTAIEVAPKLKLFDYSLSAEEQAERKRERAIEKLQPVLRRKIRAGVKSLPKKEYQLLTPEQIEAWKHYRDLRKRAERASGSSSSSAASASNSNAPLRTRNAKR